MRVTYRPGTWNALVREQALLVLPATADAALVADAWTGSDGIRELGALVDLLTSRSGGSLSSVPDFAAVVIAGQDVRVAVRGVPEIVVETAEGQTRITGTDVTTWNERLVRGATRVDVVVEPADDAELPVIAGVVRAGALVLDMAEDSHAGTSGPASAGISADAAPVAAAESAAAPAAAAPVGLPTVGAGAAGGSGVAVPPVPTPSVAIPPVAVPPVPVPAVAAPAPAAADEPNIEDTLLPEPDPADGDDAEVEDADAARAVPDDAEAEGAAADSTDAPSDIDEFEMLFGQTIHRPASESAVPPADSDLPADVAVTGDHDGATISAAEARALRKDAAPVSPEAPTVALDVVPSEGRIRVSTGQVVTLDRTVIIGRRPRSTRASGANLPHLVAVESPQQDISRSHLEVRPEGDTVVVIDLHTTNGSTLLRSGSDPVRLHPGEQTIVISGDVVDLGDGVTVAFEDLP
ncbi:FHA domain-containing protein [Microbacterium sp.]|uniref:FHA domain-containing protein n=1 Tax=Microbacterium sp. TaxID=51671 RepID=UPI00356A1A32